MAEARYDAILIPRIDGVDDIDALRQGLAQLTGVAAELVTVLPDSRGWIAVLRLPV